MAKSAKKTKKTKTSKKTAPTPKTGKRHAKAAAKEEEEKKWWFKQMKRNNKHKLGYHPDNPARIYCDGVFDMFHIGHTGVLRQGKAMFPYVHLIAGVSGDEETIRLKGKLVMDEEERAKSVMSCRYVDEVIMPCPWILTLEFLEENDIDFVAHDDLPYGSAGEDDIYAEMKKAGRFKATQRTAGISTSDLIMRIIRDYDDYVWRSMERGYSHKELNISRMKATSIKIDKTVDKMKSKVKRQLS